MIRTIAAAGTLALLSACTTSSPGAATTTPTPQRVPVATFLATVRPLYPPTNTDHDLIKLGRSDCAALEAGNPYQVMLDGLRLSVGARKARISLDASIATFCPDQTR